MTKITAGLMVEAAGVEPATETAKALILQGFLNTVCNFICNLLFQFPHNAIIDALVHDF